MRKFNWAVVAMILAATSALCMAADKPKDASTTAKKGEKPAASPGWVIVEEDFWFPLRFEPLHALDAARYRYRRNEEKEAANEIDKAVSWLKLAEGHAMPITQEKLMAAAVELTTLSKDLRAGKISDAAKVDGPLAKAAQALGEWHFFKAKESWGKDEEADAGRDLEMAAQYLQHAANSAHYEFGADSQEVISKVYHDGKLASETTKFDHNTLGMHLQGMEKAVKELAAKMLKSS
jgi:hypothetical protein